MITLNHKFVIVLVVLVTVQLGACRAAVPEPSPQDVLEALESAQNANDIDAAVALFADDGVEVNPVGAWKGQRRLRLLYGWKDWQVEHTNYRIDGNKVVYDCYLFENGEKYATETYEAVIEDGKIKTNYIIKNLD
jgi:hypothetical protein